ncbi:Uncharacterised protein [Escherichia coli]|nr:Uncharacterised protein [Escherichia coli]
MGRCYYFFCILFRVMLKKLLIRHFMIGGMKGEKVSEYSFR